MSVSVLWDWAMPMTLMLASIPLAWWMLQTRWIPPGALRIIILAIHTPLLVAAPFLQQPRSAEPTLPPLGALLMAVGAITGALALLELQHNHMPVVPDGWAPHRLVQSGIYRYIRHPLSTAQITLYLGWCCVWAALWGLLLIAPLFVLAVWLRAYLEERFILLPRFGKIYQDYQAGTGMLLPATLNVGLRRV